MELITFASVDVTEHEVAHNWITENIEPTYTDTLGTLEEHLYSIDFPYRINDLFVPREVVDLLVAVEATSEDTAYFRFVKF